MRGLKNIIKQDLAIDLGTANTLIYRQNEGIVLNEPTVIAYSDNAEVIKAGRAAKEYLGRTPRGIKVLRPMKHGIIEDFDAVTQLIKVFLDCAQERKRIFSPRVVICIPSNITQVEKRAILEAARGVGPKKVFLLEETMAAAIGAGLPVQGEEPQMVLDIGGGTTEAAVIAEWAYICCETLRLAGDEMDEAIIQWLAENRGLEIGVNTAEKVKWEIGSAWDEGIGPDLECSVAGKDSLNGMPLTVVVTSRELRPALKGPLDAISKMIKDLLNSLPSETRASIEARGITATGGGSLIRGITQFLASRTGIPFHLAIDPLTTVVQGAGRTIDAFKDYQKVFIN